ncbi:uncharacterized protein LOC124885822 [Capsicum annuum]|uniref:uncharacterized protein LOC124885822 n=1 Tax=Capsicum annuum TaxID=4072 RepID=UPI001FB0620F|nr:uncharacterized protein LOC124885822 [Capsicum annuum]
MPLVEVLEKMPGYAKFVNDLVMKKIVVSYEPEDNLQHYSVISTRSLVQKKVDLGAFTIPCTIGSLNFAKALCDLGASINLMSLAVYKTLCLGDPTPKNMRLVMADRSIKGPVGILHDVLVKVADFILPADIVVLDCETNFKVPIILGRLFLATGRVVVDMELKFRFNDKEERFEMYSSMTPQKDMSVLSIVDVFYEDGKEEAKEKENPKNPFPPPPFEVEESEESDTEVTTPPDSTASEQTDFEQSKSEHSESGEPESEHAESKQLESEGPSFESPSAKQ